MLSQDQIDFYRTNGYLGVENVLSRDEVAELRRVTDAFVEASRQVTETDNVFDLEPGHTPENPQLRRLIDPSRQHDVYARGLRHEKILDITAQLIGPGIRTNGDKLNMKSAEVGSPVEWHQDWAFYPHTNDDLLAVGVAIDDMTLENGCLLVVPGVSQGAHPRPPPQRPLRRGRYRARFHRRRRGPDRNQGRWHLHPPRPDAARIRPQYFRKAPASSAVYVLRGRCIPAGSTDQYLGGVQRQDSSWGTHTRTAHGRRPGAGPASSGGAHGIHL